MPGELLDGRVCGRSLFMLCMEIPALLPKRRRPNECKRLVREPISLSLH
jgi:hypothetical protein